MLARLECGRPCVRAKIESNQKLIKSVFAASPPSNVKEQRLIASDQGNVSKGSELSTRGLLFQEAGTIEN